MHLPAQPGSARQVLSWERLNEVLGQESHWTDKYLRLVRDSVPIAREHYCDRVQFMDGPRWRADPSRVQIFLAMGASMAANEIQTAAPELRVLGEVMGERLGGGRVRPPGRFCSALSAGFRLPATLAQPVATRADRD